MSQEHANLLASACAVVQPVAKTVLSAFFSMGNVAEGYDGRGIVLESYE